ncbi:MAG TPA: hypothetical protein VF135_08945, partial [Terriglobales bacterium]
MRRTALLLLISSIALTCLAQQAQKTESKPNPSSPSKSEVLPPELKALIDDDTAEVLRRINSVTPYEAPDLRLKQDTTYANTPVDYEPYGA